MIIANYGFTAGRLRQKIHQQSSMKLLINFATRGRAEQFFANVQTINHLANNTIPIIAKIDSDDPCDYSELSMPVYQNVTRVPGFSKNKIDAINRGDLLKYEWDILLNHSDDMWFTQQDFDLIIAEDMARLFPDTDGVLHYPDGYTGDKLMSYSIIGRKYFERDGYVYHPDFISLWCDNLAMDMAKLRGKYQYVDRSLFKHEHPVWTGAQMDESYRMNAQYYQSDQVIYNRIKQELGI